MDWDTRWERCRPPVRHRELKKTVFWTPVQEIPKKSGGLRLITDLWELNKSLSQTKMFKVESWKTVLHTLSSQDFTNASTLDLKDWFHHLTLHKRSRRLIRWKCGEVWLEDLGLTFGLASIPYWTTLLMKPLPSIFFSRTPGRGSSGTNALAINWEHLSVLYLNTSWPLIYHED